MSKKSLRRVYYSVGGLLFVFILWLLLPRVCPYDLAFDTPAAVARQFVEAVVAEDYKTAATYWRPDDIANVEANSRMSFQEFCKRYFGVRNYTVALSGTGKNGAYVVGFEGEANGIRKTYSLYLKRHEGRWKIIVDRIYP